MKKIVAIGGGEIGGYGFDIETRAIDEEIIKLSGKKNPRVLFVPTASMNSRDYAKTFENYYSDLGCSVLTLFLDKDKKLFSEESSKILSSDIIYIGGGNTKYMLDIWRKTGFYDILKTAYGKGIVLCGISAGAMCWFERGHSDYEKDESDDWHYEMIDCLGFEKGIFCPHYNNPERAKDIEKFVLENNVSVIAVEDCCALMIANGKQKIICSKSSARGFLLRSDGGQLVRTSL